MTMHPIPFNRPSLEGDEIEYMREAVLGGHASAGGPFSERATTLLREALAAPEVLLTTSCTDALEIAALLLDPEPGDTVIVPSFTFVSTALAFVRAGFRVRFCDIEERTLGVDPEKLVDLMDATVRAVVPVHYAGMPCRIDEILEETESWERAVVVEDNAHGLFAELRGRALGTLGRFGVLSFHETKNFVCGEGGAIVLNREDDVERAHILLNKGTNRRAFSRGEVDKYTWVDTGSSFGLSDVLAGFLLAQLEKRAEILEKRRQVFENYRSLFEATAEHYGYRIPIVPEQSTPGYHAFFVILDDAQRRGALLERLSRAGIHATFHYVPLHTAPATEKFTVDSTLCPVTESISSRLIRLPFFNGLSATDVERIHREFTSALQS